MRIIIKGGVWKNTEDEVLKAAIAKYGKNQWARISSLLVRKTPKQCKARWYEWLDPSIKKTEWSKTEDEKLLHLAKLMPTQWRTIAPIVGRTATQCLERYQKLLDDAEAKENEELGLTGPGAEAAPSADDIRRLRPGEIDPDPETKPARPDPIDMDEDEKEMLSEARARLANTQGKKAKRKARERQLEEARRLAVLQKKRELKAAGIIMRSRAKVKGMDYNADIPFEKKPAAGFYDTSEEQAKVYAAPVGKNLRALEGKRKADADEEAKRKRQRTDSNKEGQHQTKFLPARDAQIQKLKEAEQVSKRRKLMLPPAQVGEAELEAIVKIGQAGEYARSLVAEGASSTDGLIGEYDSLEAAKMARTPRTAPQFDNIMAEARNLRNLHQMQTPLLGQENTPLHAPVGGGTGYESITPRHSVSFTPNPLATPFRTAEGDPSTTPRVGSTPLRTPLRDNLKLNPDGSDFGPSSKRALKNAFANLPRPANDFEIVLPDEDEDEDENAVPLSEEDAAERDARVARRRAEEERKALARRSLVVQRGLPRPVEIDVDQVLAGLPPADDAELAFAQKLVDNELILLLQHDTIAHPLPGTSRPGGTKSLYEHPDDDAFVTAKSLVQDEVASMLGLTGSADDSPTTELGITRKINELSLGSDSNPSHEVASWAAERATLAFDVQSKHWIAASQLDSSVRISGLAYLLDYDRDTMAREAEKTNKQEKKLSVQLGGYQARAKALAKRLGDAFEALQSGAIDLESLTGLSTGERGAAPARVEKLSMSVDALERRERGLQDRYRELSEEKTAVVERIAALEEQLMEAAMLEGDVDMES
ncbi:pre-mRNA splicing factor component-domain-containing protein [Auriculariales sp. MPI-PUGE-AT-0066]|nr:pre-mRNA splicing factor component-domain-containing protein [Auriculariales sp. MPI-PUGE-AT-0066]